MENTNQMLLDYLGTSEPTHKGAFLQHINRLIQIPWKVGESYLDMFKSLEEYGEKYPETKEPIKNWVTLNKENISEADLNSKPINSENQHAIFNLYPNH